MAYRDELEALRARLAAVEAERDGLRARLEAALGQDAPGAAEPSRDDPEWRSVPGGAPTHVTVRNESGRKIEVYWLSYEGKERRAGTLVPGGSIREQTYVGHCWRIVDARTRVVLTHARIVPERDPHIVYREETK